MGAYASGSTRTVIKEGVFRSCLCFLALPMVAQERAEVTVAAAANLTNVLQAMAAEFEAQTGIHPVFSFASTAQLTQQIENGAPFDVFAAADTQHVDQLEQKHLLVPGSRTVYATGVLALWVPPGTKAAINRIEDLTQPDVKFIAVAKPELAPYGLATVETLKHLGLWDAVQSKIVYTENINMAKQYGTSKNADAVFTAYSLVLKEDGKVIPVDGRLHAPIEQALGIVAASKNQKTARVFTEFLLHGKGRDVLAKSGYAVPEK